VLNNNNNNNNSVAFICKRTILTEQPIKSCLLLKKITKILWQYFESILIKHEFIFQYLTLIYCFNFWIHNNLQFTIYMHACTYTERIPNDLVSKNLEFVHNGHKFQGKLPFIICSWCGSSPRCH
jgi:hypothetical protein